MTRVMIWLGLLTAGAALTACETVKGFGQDLQNISSAVQRNL